MKISPICVVQSGNSNYKTKKRAVMQHTALPLQNQAVPFKGLKATLFGSVGTGLGVALGTVLTGGLLAPLLLGSAGTYVGVLYGKSKEDDGPDEY